MGNPLRAEYYISPEDYLAAELLSEEKHEYLAGVIYAMAGPTIGHGRIADNIVRELGDQLRGRRCEVFSSDIKVRIRKGSADFFYYPDATVDCSNLDGQSYFVEEPRVIFEVLSPSTERIDRGEKLANYQALASLDAYVLVDQSKVVVTVYRRTPDGWAAELFTEKSDVLSLPAIECELSLASIYERTQV